MRLLGTAQNHHDTCTEILMKLHGDLEGLGPGLG